MSKEANNPEVFEITGVDLKYQKQAFVYEYLVDFNATRASKAIGVVVSTAQAWLKTPDVIKAIGQGMVAKAKRKQIDADWVLDKLVAMVETSVSDFMVFPEFGAPYFDLSAATPAQRALLENINIKSTVNAYDDHNIQQVVETRITLPNKIKAIEMIGKHVDVQAFRERLDVAMHSVEERLQQGRKQAALALVPEKKIG